MLKDPQNWRAQSPSNTFTLWFESLYKSLKVSYHSFHKVNMSHGRNTRKIPDQVFQYPIIPDWLFIWCKYPYPIHTRTDPKYFFQYPIHIRPEVEKPYPSAPAPCCWVICVRFELPCLWLRSMCVTLFLLQICFSYMYWMSWVLNVGVVNFLGGY